MKGLIISIEGTDGSGKHTQQQLLIKSLRERTSKVFDISFPNYDSDSSAPVKMYLSGELGNTSDCLDAYQASSLYAVDRLCTYKKTIASHYENGEIIVFDRYVQSNFIHQCSKISDENERLKFLKWDENLEYGSFKLPKPDLVFFIEMPVEKSLELARAREGLKNGKQKDIHESDTKYMENSYNTGLWVAKKYNWNLVHCVGSDGNLKSIDEIHEEIMEKVNEFLDLQNI